MSRYRIALGQTLPPPEYLFEPRWKFNHNENLFYVLNSVRPASLIWSIDGTLPQRFWGCIKHPLDVGDIFVSIFEENPLANERPEEDIDAVLQDIPLLADEPHTWMFDKAAIDELDVGDSYELHAMIEKVAGKQAHLQKKKTPGTVEGVPWFSHESLIYQVDKGYVRVPGQQGYAFSSLREARVF